MHFLTRKHLSRRTLLKGAGVTLALPLLESMIPAASRNAHAMATPRPRFGAVYIPHGVIYDQWVPNGEGANFEFSTILKPIEAYRDYLNIITDLTLPSAYKGEEGAGPNHTRSSQCWLTCVLENTGPSPTSADQLIAHRLGQDSPLPSLELSLTRSTTISYLTPTTPLPMEINPRVAFERLFGDGSTAEDRAVRRHQAGSVLDSLLGDVAALRSDLPQPDRVRLNRYLDDVREVERRIHLQSAALPEDVSLPDKPAGIPADFEEHARLMFDIIALAWQADMTRVATLMIERELGNPVFPNSGVEEPFHNLSHHSEVPVFIERYTRMNVYHTQTTIGYFLQRLAETPDGDGTLLDHSLVMYGSGMGNGNEHDHTRLPLLLAGRASGALKAGRHIRANHGTPDVPLANVLVSVLDKVGVPVESFGESTGAVNL